MERRRRRRRHRKNGLSGSSGSPKPLSIDMLRKKRHKNAKSKRVAAVRLDLDDSGGFNNSGFNRKQIIWKILALVLVIAAITTVLYDYGFSKLGTQISDFVSSIGKGAKQTVTEMSAAGEYSSLIVENQISQLQGKEVLADADTKSVFYPEGKAEAISRIQLAIETSKVGLLSQAMLLIDEAKIIDPDVTGLDYIRANLYATAEKTDKAREFYRLATEQQDTYFLSHLELGKLEYKAENYNDAVTHLAIARKLKPGDVQIAAILSYALRFNHQAQEGLFEAQAAQKLEPEIKAYEVLASLAAIQAGTYEPSTQILTIVNAPEIDSSASPFDLVVAAGWEHWQGNPEKVKQYWDIIRPHSTTMASLKELEDDPLFQLDPAKATTSAIAPSKPVATFEQSTLDFPEATLDTNEAFQEDIPEPKFDLDLSMEANKNADSGFLNLETQP